MPNQRFFLWGALGLVLWLNYEAWMRDYAPPPAAAQSVISSGPGSSTTPSSSRAAPGTGSLAESVPGLPATATPSTSPPTPAPADAAPALSALVAPTSTTAPKIRVVTDVLDLDIGLTGGTLQRADLRQYPKEKNEPGTMVRLFEDAPGEPPFLFQSGLTTGGTDTQPNQFATFTAPRQEYRLNDGQTELAVPLTWTDPQGVTVTKTFTFKRGNYAIGLDYQVQNHSSQPWRAASYVQLFRHQEHVDRSMWNVTTNAFKGPAIYDGKRYSTLNIEKEDDSHFSATVKDGWLAALQHHFVAAAIPHAGDTYQYRLQVQQRDFVLSAVGPAQTVAPGAEQHFSEKVYVGPKLQAQLQATGPELARTTDYGVLTIVAQPLFKLLALVHRLVGNWGWTIIIVTALIKLAFYPLSETSGRSMAKMRAMAPRIKNIQERYKDNREQLGRAMMDIYKREKINPLAGCLPMVVQIPVFLAFYRVLLESVEMRQAPFMLWINDLSSRDPIFILPLLMGAAMFGQFKLNPAPPDPMQAKVFMFMPVVMTVMFAFFPAGLVLYWLTNTLLSIAQQWNINRRIEAAAAKRT